MASTMKKIEDPFISVNKYERAARVCAVVI